MSRFKMTCVVIAVVLVRLGMHSPAGAQQSQLP
jgi:hypothetical protein